MPAAAPAPQPTATAQLRTLGERIRAQRQGLRISANAAAQAAGMSRVTLHRIEHGEASVTMGAYVNALTALGLGLQVLNIEAAAIQPTSPQQHSVHALVRIADHPQLRQLAWQLPATALLTEQEALALVERNWRHLDFESMEATERKWIEALVTTQGGGHLLV
jgi:transcriptional regulator with XRE-family HTH domain